MSDKQPHPDDLAVDRFAAALKAKLAKQRAKGYGGWDDESACPVSRLQAQLTAHVVKGDPVDVGNFAMMLFNRGASTRMGADYGEPYFIDKSTSVKAMLEFEKPAPTGESHG